MKGAATMEKVKKLAREKENERKQKKTKENERKKLAREKRSEFASLDLSNIVDRTTRRGENVVCLKYSGIDADISVIHFLYFISTHFFELSLRLLNFCA